MLIVRKISDLKACVKKINRQRFSLGFVPTMGDLHEGHLSLIRRSKRENGITAVSIFVNPSQFNQKEDFDTYVRNEKSDLKLLKKEKVDLVFLPRAEEFYPKGFQTWVTVESLSHSLCGSFREGHFKGVATVVLKLFQLFAPTRAYFGLKDYQQCKIIQRMVKDLELPIRIVLCETVREPNGLAMSSRNERLTASERGRAAFINMALKSTAQALKLNHGMNELELSKYFKKKMRLTSSDKVEYIQFVNGETLASLKTIQPPLLIACAIWIGGTRLIDNILVHE